MAYNDRKFDFPVLKKQASGYKIRVARTELLLILALLKITARARGLQWPQIRFPGIEETSIGIHCRKRHGGLNRKKHRNEKPFRRWIYKNTKSIIYFTGSFAAFSQQQKLDEEIKKMDENHKVLQEPRGDLGMLSRWWLLYDRADLQSFSQHWRDPWRQWIENG